MGKTSAGLLMYRIRDGGAEVLLVHPGGPLWTKGDSARSIAAGGAADRFCRGPGGPSIDGPK
jgi:predicted NUDIX family NTP pyrophosphohydrolase